MGGIKKHSEQKAVPNTGSSYLEVSWQRLLHRTQLRCRTTPCSHVLLTKLTVDTKDSIRSVKLYHSGIFLCFSDLNLYAIWLGDALDLTRQQYHTDQEDGRPNSTHNFNRKHPSSFLICKVLPFCWIATTFYPAPLYYKITLQQFESYFRSCKMTLLSKIRAVIVIRSY